MKKKVKQIAHAELSGSATQRCGLLQDCVLPKGQVILREV
jgi:hypothetical protein